MSINGKNLWLGAEPVGKYAQELKLLLVELTQKKSARKRPYVRIMPNGCWVWIRAITMHGYGNIGWRWPGGRTTMSSHRFFYTKIVGKVPGGLDLDHLCRNRACCNPAHIEPVTTAENLRRGRAFRENQDLLNVR